MAAAGPNGAHVWRSGKHKHRGGDVQVIAAPDGLADPGLPGPPGPRARCHLPRTHGLVEALNRLTVTLGIPTLTDLGHENAGDGFRNPVKKPMGGELTQPLHLPPYWRNSFL